MNYNWLIKLNPIAVVCQLRDPGTTFQSGSPCTAPLFPQIPTYCIVVSRDAQGLRTMDALQFLEVLFQINACGLCFRSHPVDPALFSLIQIVCICVIS